MTKGLVLDSFRSCNLCGETSAIQFLFEKGKWKIVRCLSCSLVYCNELPVPLERPAVYGRDFFEVGEKYSDSPCRAGIKNARDRIRRILKLPGIRKEAWLDVGSATGDFVEAVKSEGIPAQGVEISSFAVNRARERGLESIRCGDFLEMDLAEACYDLVTMWDFIEHVPAPKEALLKAWRALRPGGYLVLTTGDIESSFARWTGRFWHLMIPPRHLYFFSVKTLCALLGETGFQPVSVTRPPRRVDLDFLIGKSAGLLGEGVARRMINLVGALPLCRWTPRVNFGDIVTVCARKQVSRSDGKCAGFLASH